MNQQLTVGHKLSMFLDLVVMLLWFLMIKFENKGLLTGLVIITILHICNLLFAIYILRSNQVRYSLDQQRKKTAYCFQSICVSPNFYFFCH